MKPTFRIVAEQIQFLSQTEFSSINEARNRNCGRKQGEKSEAVDGRSRKDLLRKKAMKSVKK